MEVLTSIITNKNMLINTIKQEIVSDNCFFLNNKNVGFKGGVPKVTEAIKVDDALKILEKEVGTSAKEYFDQTIRNLTSKEKSGVKLKDGILEFDKDTFGGKLYRQLLTL